MKTIMNVNELSTIQQLSSFLAGTQPVIFCIDEDKRTVYQTISKTLSKFAYSSLNKCSKGIVIAYLIKITGYSRQQLTRLIGQFKQTGSLVPRPRAPNGFKRRFTAKDVQLLAKLDELHDTLSGPATKKLCERAFHHFGQQEYHSLASISVSHLYNLRHCSTYTEQCYHYTKTTARASTLGVRRKPNPEGQPGYIRVDTVHQGDVFQQKGVYHINAIDEVTQFEVILSVERINKEHLLPVLRQLIDTFPFFIKGFHSDNGSEYVNYKVVELLHNLLIDFTKSRSRHTNDNALAECKNGAIVRKVLGYHPIPKHFASALNSFHRRYLMPYINYHRPCFFPVTTVDSKGKERKKYPYNSMMTPYDKFKSLSNAVNYLKPGVSLAALDKLAMSINDMQAAQQLQQAKRILFKQIHEQRQAS
jgi:transposase InsO family protein